MFNLNALFRLFFLLTSLVDILLMRIVFYFVWQGKKIIGANCGTNDAKIVTLSSTAAADGKRTYECVCRDTVATGVASMYCYLHYWECPS